MPSEAFKYFVFDVESVADGHLVSKLRYPGENLDPAEAIGRFKAELIEKHGSDFVPYTYQIPVSVVVAKITSDYHLADIAVLDDDQFRPHVITRHFWQGWEGYKCPTFVSFNGRTFDMPLLELAAFRYGISIPKWYALSARTYDQPRNRYNLGSHLDLHDVLTNFGASRFHGGLNLAANLLGKPGKMDVQGDMVQEMYDAGRLVEINDYCRCDVLDTYFVFLRSQVLVGNLTLDEEQAIISQTKTWLIERSGQVTVYQRYLEQWGDWHNPWQAGEAQTSNTGS